MHAARFRSVAPRKGYIRSPAEHYSVEVELRGLPNFGMEAFLESGTAIFSCHIPKRRASMLSEEQFRFPLACDSSRQEWHLTEWGIGWYLFRSTGRFRESNPVTDITGTVRSTDRPTDPRGQAKSILGGYLIFMIMPWRRTA